METIAIAGQQRQIQWKQLWSLAALYGSVVIGWIAYENYQPKLLTRFSFEGYSFALMVFQGLILVLVPPFAGRLGDRFRLQQGNRLPVITTGISFAAMIFMAVAFTLFGNPGDIFRWLLPLLIVLWLVAMSIFTSPALSTLELFAPVEKLPRAMAVLTIVANLLYAIEPVIVDVIDYLGAPVTFMVGGTVVFLSGYGLKKNSLLLMMERSTGQPKPLAAVVLDTQRSRFLMIVLLGIALGIPTTAMLNLFPEMLDGRHVALTSVVAGKYFLVAVLALSALISVPVSYLVDRLGLLKSFLVSVAVVLLSMGVLYFITVSWIAIVMLLFFSVAFTALSASALPLAMRWSNYYEKVMCVGLFFSGVALPNGILEAFLAWQ